MTLSFELMADEQSDLIQTEFDSTPEASTPPKKKVSAKKATRKAAKKAPKKEAKKKVARNKTAEAKDTTPDEKTEKEASQPTAKKKVAKRAPRRKETQPGNEAPAKNKEASIEVVSEDSAEKPKRKDLRKKPSQPQDNISKKEQNGPRHTPKKAAKKATRKILAVPEGMKAQKEEPPVEEPSTHQSEPQRNGRPMGRVKGGPVGKGAQRNEQAHDGRERKDKHKRVDRRKGPSDSDEVNPRGSKLTGDPVEALGILETTPKGFGFLREPDRNYEQSRSDVFVPPDMVQQFALRDGQLLKGKAQQGPRGPQLVELTDINGYTVEDARDFPHFEELKAIFPNKRIGLETVPERFTTRVLDILAPVGRGQRGLIVSPPRAGKTTLLLHIAEAVQELHSETMHLMVCLVDERPEEVTEFRRQLPDAEIYASSNDEPARNHCRLAELCIERAKRLVEAGQHVFLVMDSITRLARAYNNTMGGSKKGRGRGIQSGGIMAGALEEPRRLFAAARNTREAGSLTILGTALVQTNSKADEAIFMEFKGTGNMELVLDRRIAEHFVFPAVDLFKSGTRREELLLPEHTLQKINLIRRGLAGHRPIEAMERLLFFLKKFPNNAQMLMEIKG